MKTHVPSFKNQMAKRMIQTLSNNKEEEDIKTSFLVASIKKEMEKMRKEIEEATARSAKSSQSSPSQRTTAMCGNLGWDTEPDVLEERCNTVLTEISMDSHVVRVTATRAKAGSSCEIEFDSAAHLQQARVALMAKRRQFNAGHVVWLNVKQTDEERRPSRIFHRVADFLEMLEADREGEARKIEKNPKMKSVKVSGRVVGYPRNGTWTWTAAAATFYNEEELQMAASFAESQ